MRPLGTILAYITVALLFVLIGVPALWFLVECGLWGQCP